MLSYSADNIYAVYFGSAVSYARCILAKFVVGGDALNTRLRVKFRDVMILFVVFNAGIKHCISTRIKKSLIKWWRCIRVWYKCWNYILLVLICCLRHLLDNNNQPQHSNHYHR